MGLTEEIDIPESGAVFTLGKSYLSENHQSYFFIKNDAIRKLICGSFQSAVVCESGRLFVWGENQFGQLGIGSTEIVTKPSCVKTIKALGYKVRNAAYGQSFGVILTENNRIFFSGKSIFDEKVRFREKFWNLGNDVLVSRKPFEIEEFSDCLKDEQGNVTEAFVDVSAGDNHFVALTGAGKLYGWGSNEHHQIGAGDAINPMLISRNEVVRVVSCGRKCTAFITAKNEIFIVGTLNNLQFGALSKINTTSFEELMYSIYTSDDDEIYLVINSGEIFKSIEKDENLSFAPHNVISENIRKICTGNGFVSIVTESNRLLTTFSEKSSANDNGRLKSPRELRKFSRLNVLDAVSGSYHLLVHGVQPNRTDTITSTSSNEFEDDAVNHNLTTNDFSKTYTKGQATINSTLAEKLKECLTIKETLASKIPIAEVRRKSNSDKGSKTSSRKSSQNSMTDALPIEPLLLTETDTFVEHSLDKLSETDENQRPLSQHSIEKSLSLNEFEKLEQEEMAAEKAELEKIANEVNNSSVEIIHNPESVLAEEPMKTEPLLNVASPESQISRKSSAITEIYLSPRTINMKNDISKQDDKNESENIESIKNEMIADSKDPEKYNTTITAIEPPVEINKIVKEDKPVSIASRPQSIVNINNDDQIQLQLSEKFGIKFIDNGIEMSTPMDPDDVLLDDSQAMDTNTVADLAITLTADEMVDKLLGEELNGNKELEVIANTKEETIQALKEVVEDVIEPVDVRQKKFRTPLKKKLSIDKPDDEDGERTTASITSISSDKNTFDTDDDNDSRTTRDGGSPKAVGVQGNGRVRRFINDMRHKARNISCKSSNTVTEQMEGEHKVDEDITPQDKNSKVCNIM